MSNVIEPSWEVFGPCRRCGAADGAPCVDLRIVRSVTPPWARRKMRNPHKGRQQVRN
jgi:hypothetical protein